jgi:hypothetical protein
VGSLATATVVVVVVVVVVVGAPVVPVVLVVLVVLAEVVVAGHGSGLQKRSSMSAGRMQWPSL